MAVDQPARSGSPSSNSEEEDDLDRRIAEYEFVLAREQALNAARTVYRAALVQLQPAVTTDSISAAVVAGCGNQDELSAAELEAAADSSQRTPSTLATSSKLNPSRSYPDITTDIKTHSKQHNNIHIPEPKVHWATFYLPLLLCLSILTVPAEWAAITHVELRPNPTFQRLVFQVAAQIILSFLGICCPRNLTPSLTALHRILKASVLCSWILSCLSYTRTMQHVAEQELALLLSFFRMSISMDIFTLTPRAAIAFLTITATRCALLISQLSITLQPTHVLIATASATLSPWLMHHISRHMRPAASPPPTKAALAGSSRDACGISQRL